MQGMGLCREIRCGCCACAEVQFSFALLCTRSQGTVSSQFYSQRVVEGKCWELDVNPKGVRLWGEDVRALQRRGRAGRTWRILTPLKWIPLERSLPSLASTMAMEEVPSQSKALYLFLMHLLMSFEVNLQDEIHGPALSSTGWFQDVDDKCVANI